MKPTQSKLIKQKVRYAIEENELYFDVQEIKQLYPTLKFPPEKIKSLPIGGVFTNTIRVQDIELMTEFDRKVIQLMNFRK